MQSLPVTSFATHALIAIVALACGAGLSSYGGMGVALLVCTVGVCGGLAMVVGAWWRSTSVGNDTAGENRRRDGGARIEDGVADAELQLHDTREEASRDSGNEEEREMENNAEDDKVATPFEPDDDPLVALSTLIQEAAADAPQEPVNNLTTRRGHLMLNIDGRPLAEPPVFNYERFVEERLTSEKKLRAIFADDPVRRTTFRDAEQERELLEMYIDWVDGDFYQMFNWHLKPELMHELSAVQAEAAPFQRTLTALERWELRALDSEGSTKDVEQDLHKGVDVFDVSYGGVISLEATPEEVAEAKAKYGHLLSALPHYPRHDLETFEYYQLDEDRIGTTKIEQRLKEGEELFTANFFGGIQAREKYSNLFAKQNLVVRRELQRLIQEQQRKQRLLLARQEHDRILAG